ncbi:MAG: hypothetical protein ACRC41_05520 [Sarcina sp.]
MFEVVNKIDFMLEVNIKVNNITQGFEKYKYKILAGNEEKLNLHEEKILDENYKEKFLSFFRELFLLNDKEGILVDFYMENLTQESIDKMMLCLNGDEGNVLKEFIEKSNCEGTYFKIKDLKLFLVIAKLSIKEMFFSTFYLLNPQITIWSNYNKEFPVFYLDENSLEPYKKIIKENSLFLREN